VSTFLLYSPQHGADSVDSAENGCFIKTRSVNTSSRGGFEQQQQTQQGSTQWLNMVANLNMTWKSACLEILNYVSISTLFFRSQLDALRSSPNVHPVHLLKNVLLLLYGGSGLVRRMTVQIGSGLEDRLLKRKTISSTGTYTPLPHYLLSVIKHYHSLGERYGLRIIPGTNSFLVLPNNISRSSAVGAILHPGGPAHSPLVGRAAWMGPEVDSVPVVPEEWDFVLAMSGDEKLLRRLGELDQAETVTISTSGKGTDAKWKMGRGRAGEVLSELANA